MPRSDLPEVFLRHNDQSAQRAQLGDGASEVLAQLLEDKVSARQPLQVSGQPIHEKCVQHVSCQVGQIRDLCWSRLAWLWVRMLITHTDHQHPFRAEMDC